MINKKELLKLIKRHQKINEQFESGQNIDPELTKKFITFPILDINDKK
jgi:hypothetical protein